jgi:hypothetical protein
MAVANNKIDTKDSGGALYIDCGASDHIIPYRDDLRAQSPERFQLYAYGPGALRVAPAAEGQEYEAGL